MDKNGRHELKYHINNLDYLQLRTVLHSVAKPDINAAGGKNYIVRSLYFDNYTDKAVMEKLSGQSRREKFRLRLYNGDTSFIRLEKKSKKNKLTYKEGTNVTFEKCKELLAGDYSTLKISDNPLSMELYTKIRSQNLRPRNIVEYNREAYVYPAGNVRVTIDSQIKTSNNVAAFLNSKLIAIPAANTGVMEIKYDGFLPDIMRGILQIDARNQTEFSKYVAARFV